MSVLSKNYYFLLPSICSSNPLLHHHSLFAIHRQQRSFTTTISLPSLEYHPGSTPCAVLTLPYEKSVYLPIPILKHPVSCILLCRPDSCYIKETNFFSQVPSRNIYFFSLPLFNDKQQITLINNNLTKQKIVKPTSFTTISHSHVRYVLHALGQYAHSAIYLIKLYPI